MWKCRRFVGASATQKLIGNKTKNHKNSEYWNTSKNLGTRGIGLVSRSRYI